MTAIGVTALTANSRSVLASSQGDPARGVILGLALVIKRGPVGKAGPIHSVHVRLTDPRTANAVDNAKQVRPREITASGGALLFAAPIPTPARWSHPSVALLGHAASGKSPSLSGDRRQGEVGLVAQRPFSVSRGHATSRAKLRHR